jgi:hypothetical protein
LNEGVPERKHLQEARIHAELDGEKKHHKREGPQDRQDDRTKAEHDVFDTLQRNLP